jgi:ABC-2 type transport system permease protein
VFEDIFTMVWKEFREIVQGSSKNKSAGWLRMLIPVFFAGVLLPSRMGGQYLTGAAPLAGLAWILPMVGIALTVDSFAGERERRTLETLLASRLSDEAILIGKLSASVLYAWALMMASLVLAVVVVNVTHPNGTLQLFRARYAAGLVGFGFLMATMVCSIAVLVSLRAATVRQASQNLAFGMMAVYFALIFGFQALSRPQRARLLAAAMGGDVMRNALIGLGLLIALDALLLGMAKARFRRARLILD